MQTDADAEIVGARVCRLTETVEAWDVGGGGLELVVAGQSLVQLDARGKARLLCLLMAPPAKVGPDARVGGTETLIVGATPRAIE